MVNAFEEIQVALHKKENDWDYNMLWDILTDLIKSQNQELHTKEDFLAFFRKYFLSPDGSLLMFGKDCEHPNDSLEVRMGLQNKRRGHKAIFIIVSDVPELTDLLKQILRKCSIIAIELRAKDFSDDVNVSKSSVVSAILNGADNSNNDVNQMQRILDLVHLAISLQLKEALEQTDPSQKKQKNYNTRNSVSVGMNLVKNYEVTDAEGNVYIKGFRGEVDEKKHSQDKHQIYDVKFEDGLKETMDFEEVIGKELSRFILNLCFILFFFTQIFHNVVCIERYNRQMKMFLDARVAKYFGDELYFGSVIDYSTDASWWRVKYDDKDEQDMDRCEIIQAMILRNDHAQDDCFH